jgi:hypothetical protein
MSERPKKDIDAIFAEGTEIDRALAKAVREAIRRHKLLGNPIAIWRDNQVVWLQPDEIEIPGDEGR